MSRRKSLSAISLSLIAVSILSGSFLFHILTMAVSASELPSGLASGAQRQPAAMAEMPCCLDCAPAAPAGGQAFGSAQSAGWLNCCSGQVIRPTIVSANYDLLSHPAAAFSTPISPLTAWLVQPRRFYETEILAPPPLLALRSVIKLE